MENITRISRNTSLVFLSLNLKVSLNILIPGKKLSILPTLIWKRLIFKYF